MNVQEMELIKDAKRLSACADDVTFFANVLIASGNDDEEYDAKKKRLERAIEQYEITKRLIEAKKSNRELIEKTLMRKPSKAVWKTFEIWQAGFSAVVYSEMASLQGDTFRDACIRYFEANPNVSFRRDDLTLGERLFDNENDAREAFG